MAKPKDKSTDLMEKIVSLCKRRGFIFQSSEIYGGISGFWDYGPYGAELKRNVKDFWWKSMTQKRDDVVGIDATIIMHPKVWEASGHTSTFSDPMSDCLVTKKRFRSDQIEPADGTVFSYSGAKDSETGKESKDPISVLLAPGKNPGSAEKVAKKFYADRGITNAELILEKKEEVKGSTSFNPENGAQLTEPRAFNLMFKTFVGPVEDDKNVAYLRPETAQAIFTNFKNVQEVARKKVPFGIAQIGKAFRNEINPRNFTFRSREFEQMEVEFFIKPDEVVGADENKEPGTLDAPESDWGWSQWHKYWVEQRLRWYESIGLERSTLELYYQSPEDLAHYARATVDILYKFPFGTEELEGIAARGNYDLSQHQEHSGKPMEFLDDEAKSKYVPHVIEPSAGVDRLVLALICNAYQEEEITDDKGKTDKRTILKFHPRIAPIKVAILPLLKNRPEMVKKAKEIKAKLQPFMSVFYDETGAIGRRYRRQDEIGTPFCVTIDFETLGDGDDKSLQDTVTLRERDSMSQKRVPIDSLLSFLMEQIH